MSDSLPDRDISWSTEGVEGAWRHLNRVWRLTKQITNELANSNPRSKLNKDRQIDKFIKAHQILLRVSHLIKQLQRFMN